MCIIQGSAKIRCGSDLIQEMENRFRSSGIENQKIIYGFIPKLMDYGQFFFKISVSACILRLSSKIHGLENL
jgi:hypothetical protein